MKKNFLRTGKYVLSLFSVCLLFVLTCTLEPSANEIWHGLTSGTTGEATSEDSIVFTVKFDKNGGDTEADPSTIDIVSPVTTVGAGNMPTFPSRADYIFAGWNTQANGNGTSFAGTTPVTKSITVYAQWIKNTLDPSPLLSISADTSSAITTYTEGNTLYLAGVIVTAHYADSTSSPVTAYTTFPAAGALLTVEDSTVLVSYTEGGITKTTSFAITVEENIIIPPEEAELIFSDEFSGTSLDTKKWNLCPELDRQGRSTWKDDMVSVSGGYLHLKFRRDPDLGATKSNDSEIAKNWIRAGAIRTRTKDWNTMLFEHTFGYYEARIKFPVVSGTWGAFWLMSPTVEKVGNGGIDGTEIDIIESIGNQNGKYNAALHWDGYTEPDHKTVESTKCPVMIYNGDFHIISLDWTPTEYVFYIDGVEFWRVDGGPNFKNVGINQTPDYIKLTVESAVWAGKIPDTFTESEMLVDYVRVYNQRPKGK